METSAACSVVLLVATLTRKDFSPQLAVAALLGLIVPFSILAIGIGTGYIEMH